jgi:arginine deiminase
MNENFKTDALGNQIRIENIKPIDLARDALVVELVNQARVVSNQIAGYKIHAFADIEALVELSAEQYGVKMGGKKGNITMLSFDGKYKVQRAMNEHLTFDERLQAAKVLIDECLNDWTADANVNVQTIINKAFEVDKEGNINTGRVLTLRRLDIQDERWLRAMAAISDSIQSVGSKAYIRIYEREADTDKYVPISLDIATV